MRTMIYRHIPTVLTDDWIEFNACVCDFLFWLFCVRVSLCVFFVIFSVSCHYYSANDGRLVTEIKYLIVSSGTWM